MHLSIHYLNHRLLLWLAAIAIAISTFAIGLTILSLRTDAINDAAKDAQNIAIMLSKQTASSVQAIDIVLNDLQRRIASSGVETPKDFERFASTNSLNKILSNSLSHLSQAEVITLADRNGQVQNFTRSWPAPPINLFDRDYFQYARANNDNKLYISTPVKNRATGTMTIYFSKRINSSNGSFLGVALVGVSLDYFQHIYNSVASLPDENFYLLRSDGTVLIRYSDKNNHSGEKMPPNSPWYQLVATGGGNYRSNNINDSITRMVAVQPLKSYPLVINVTVLEATALQTWRKRAIMIGMGAAVGLLCFGALLALMLSQLNRLMHSEEALSKRSRDLEIANIKFDAAVNNMSQGLCLFDATERIVVCNPQYYEMYGLAAEDVKIGSTLSEVLAKRVANGTFSGDPHKYRKEFLNAYNNGRTHVQEINSSGERILLITNRPIKSGGWVSTHEDITKRRRAELELEKAHQRLSAVIEAMPAGLVIFDAQDRLVAWNRIQNEMFPNTAHMRVPGVKWEDIIRAGLASGQYADAIGREEEWLQQRIALHAKKHAVGEELLSTGRWLRHEQFRTDDGNFISVRTDVTELKQREEELKNQNARFDTALQHMSQGLSMHDKDHRLVVYNDQYVAMCGVPPGLIKPGQTISSILEARKVAGTFTGDVESYIADLTSQLSQGQNVSKTTILENGRTITVVNRPMVGGGWVATHDDITEKTRAEQELDETKKFLDSIISNIPVAIVVKDAKTRRFVLTNRTYETLVGMSQAELMGKTAFDIYRPEDAELMDQSDKDSVENSADLLSNDYEVKTSQRGSRIFSTKRIVTNDIKGNAKYLIVVIDDITERKQSEQQITFMAHHDALTGLANRAAVAQKIEEAAARQRRHRDPFSVLLLDLDRFKAVNDTLGHPAGDSLLREVATRLKALLRDTDVLARLGGDEFVIIQFGDIDQRQAASALADRILNNIARTFIIDDHEVDIGASIGIALAPEHGMSPDELLKMADMALYCVKSAGRNGYRFFDSMMSEVANTRHEIESDLRRAIQQGELELHYQPIIDTKTGRMRGAEALIRWQHPTKGLILPDRFIPLAEETGLIIQIGEWSLLSACAEAATWPGDIKVAINLSPIQFRKSNLPDVVMFALAQSGLPPERLELEITETALIESAAVCLPALRQFKNLGIAVALDDFGTGYSSLSLLTLFPFDKIKIDRTFTQNLTKRTDCAAIISATLTLAQSLEIATTAEGVETADQYRHLRLAGVGSLQGYLFKTPGPASELDFEARYDVPEISDAA